MPIYEYQCTNCHHDFELIQKMSDAQTTMCPQCETLSAVRLVSAAGFQLKGTGWYVTDFKNKGMPKDKSAAPADGSAASSDTKATESTPSTKGDDK
ncbi:MAG: zinc ribbon domain-containing protein [Legionellaceae bacterium]|nr:zinc ribbon domain-containing protein [Legionellaceae bacterium]